MKNLSSAKTIQAEFTRQAKNGKPRWGDMEVSQTADLLRWCSFFLLPSAPWRSLHARCTVA